MKQAILKCGDCHMELNRSEPFIPEDESKVRMTSGMAAGPCPRGCRSTFSDLNLNTSIVIYDIPDAERVDANSKGVEK